jgi:hypothetical protein
MKIISTIALLGLCAVASAQLLPPEFVSARSMSGQFVVSELKERFQSAPPKSEKGEELLTFTPAFLVVSCERIKQAVWRELGASGNWSGRILIGLRPARTADDPVTVVCNRYKDGWSYQMELPQGVKKLRFMRAIVQTLLLEIANRNAGERSAEIPEWLTEGLAAKLLASNEDELLPQPPTNSIRGVMVGGVLLEKTRINPLKGARINPLEGAKQILREHPQLTLEQLSWPNDAQLSGRDEGVFESSAQLFTSELLLLKDGPACMTTMLSELGRCYNWQTAFLRAFKDHFTKLLDVEKWWALQVVHLTGRDPTLYWTLEESQRRLDETLLTPAQVRLRADQLPASTRLSLQAVITEWDFASQRAALNEKLQALGFLRLHLAPELAALGEDYRQTLEEYLKQRTRLSLPLPGLTRPAPTVRSVVRDAVRQLDALDEKRTGLHSFQATAR